MLQQITPHLWLQLSHEARVTLSSDLHLQRSGHPEIVQEPTGTRLLSDGHTALDLMGITLEKLQAMTRSDSKDFYGLFEVAADMAEGKVTLEEVVIEAEVEEPFVLQKVSKTQKTNLH
jgi:hypothetical protein